MVGGAAPLESARALLSHTAETVPRAGAAGGGRAGPGAVGGACAAGRAAGAGGVRQRRHRAGRRGTGALPAVQPAARRACRAARTRCRLRHPVAGRHAGPLVMRCPARATRRLGQRRGARAPGFVLRGQFWKGGAETFMHKGTNNRWRDILSDDELILYDAACKRALTPDCREWLENGGTI